MTIFRDAKDPNKFYEVFKVQNGIHINFIEKRGDGFKIIRDFEYQSYRGAYANERIKETPFDLLIDTDTGEVYESKATVWREDVGFEPAPVGGIKRPIIIDKTKVEKLYQKLQPISEKEEAEIIKKIKS